MKQNGYWVNMDFYKISTYLQGQTKRPFFKIADEIGIASGQTGTVPT